MRMSVKSANVQGCRTKVKQATEAGLSVMAKNALEDCRPFVPYLTGALQRSGQTLVENQRAFLEWGTDASTAAYARYQYYTTLNHNTPGNAAGAPKATDHWFEHAKVERFNAWQGILNAEIARIANGR